MSQLHALLIAVDFYFPDRLANGSYYPSLGGCVRDVRHVEAFLTTRLHVPSEQITKLSATNTGQTLPAEPFEDWPTYANMVNAFKSVTARAEPGDQVYIHYSGHGGRTPTAYPQVKGESGLDEALVPTDIGKTQSRYLRDIELAFLLQAMVEKGLLVTLVLDSCHSGGATRGPADAVARGIGTVDDTPRPTDSLVAAPEELVRTWTQASGGATRSVKPASGWLAEPQGYTLFAACRANELAYEYAFDGKERNGALTYWLLDSLRQAGPGFSYKMLHDRILAKVHGTFDQQTPQLQGEGNRTLFGGDRIQPVYAVPVLRVEENGADGGTRVQLNAGEVHGVQPGARFSLYPHGSTDFADEGRRIATVDVTEVDEVSSWAAVIERANHAPIDSGAQAVALTAPSIRLQRGALVPIDDAALRGRVEDAIREGGKGFVVLADGPTPVSYQVAVNAAGEFEVWDPAGVAIANLRPPLRVDDAGALDKLVKRLVHLVRYRTVLELDAPDASARQRLDVEFSIAGKDGGAEIGEHIAAPGDLLRLRITNTLPPGALNDADRMLNITILVLGVDWSIIQVYPSGAGFFEPLDPGETMERTFDAYLPVGYTETASTFKIFATRETTNFRWLELPALDQPITRAAVTRGGIDDPLEQLLAAITGEEAPTTRSFRMRDAPKGWTVAQAEVRVVDPAVSEAMG